MSKDQQGAAEKKGLFPFRKADPKKSDSKKAAIAKKNAKKPFNVARVFRETLAELKKVTWPTRRELINYTVIVCVFVLIIAAFVGVFDLGMSAAYTAMFGV